MRGEIWIGRWCLGARAETLHQAWALGVQVFRKGTRGHPLDGFFWWELGAFLGPFSFYLEAMRPGAELAGEFKARKAAGDERKRAGRLRDWKD